MAGRAQWLAERQASEASVDRRTPPSPPPSSPRRGDHCRRHRTALLDFDSRGTPYRKPTCLECLPTHRAGCAQLEYVERQALWIKFGQSENPDFDPTEEEFWDRFGWVAECRCPERKRALELKDPPPALTPPAPAFQLNIGGKITGHTWHSLRPRLGRLARQVLGKKAALHWELEQLAPALDLIPQESPRARARAILKQAEEFELAGTGLT